MLDIGTVIKNKRLASSLTHEEISLVLKIKTRLLIALEENNVEAFGSKAYYLGYLKQYMKFLDIEDLKSLNENLFINEQDFSINVPYFSRLVPSLSFSIICLIIAILIYFFCDNYLTKNVANLF